MGFGLSPREPPRRASGVLTAHVPTEPGTRDRRTSLHPQATSRPGDRPGHAALEIRVHDDPVIAHRIYLAVVDERLHPRLVVHSHIPHHEEEPAVPPPPGTATFSVSCHCASGASPSGGPACLRWWLSRNTGPDRPSRPAMLRSSHRRRQRTRPRPRVEVSVEQALRLRSTLFAPQSIPAYPLRSRGSGFSPSRSRKKREFSRAGTSDH